MREAIRADEANDLCVEMALHTRADAQYDARIAGRWSSGVISGHHGSSGVISVRGPTRASPAARRWSPRAPRSHTSSCVGRYAARTSRRATCVRT
jgi:hypothetical protein